jgi:hypothetical protein
MSRANRRIIHMIDWLIAVDEPEVATRRAKHLKSGAHDRQDRARRIALLAAAGVEC